MHESGADWSECIFVTFCIVALHLLFYIWLWRCMSCSLIPVTILSIAAYVASILGIVLMYVWYAPKPTCRLNILFITLTLVLLQFMTFVSVHSKVNRCSFHWMQSTSSILALSSLPRAKNVIFGIGERRIPVTWADGNVHCVSLLERNEEVTFMSNLVSQLFY